MLRNYFFIKQIQIKPAVYFANSHEKNKINNKYVEKKQNIKKIPITGIPVISIEKFNEERLFCLYSQTNNNLIKGVYLFLILLNVGSYIFYQNYYEHTTEYLEIIVFQCLPFTLLMLYAYKWRNSAKKIWLKSDGENILVEYYRWFGFGIDTKKIKISDFIGVAKRLGFNSAMYLRKNRVNRLYYNNNYILENVYLNEVFEGRPPKIAQFKEGFMKRNLKNYTQLSSIK